MNRRLSALALSACLAASPVLAHGDHDEHAGHVMVGTVDFANSCAPEVQADFARGVAMLHSFWYSAGQEAFETVLKKDPTCAIADWGIASLLMLNPLNGVGATKDGAQQAQARIDDARRIGAKTQRERDYVEAVAAYYQDFANRPERVRQAERAKAYEALAARYPDDDEAQIFSALYIAGTQSQADQSYAALAKAAAVLEKEFAKHPDHPGVAHYLIHSFDAPPLAAQGLAAARAYAAIAPDAPHALHMPSHIFTRVGAWEDSAATNGRAFKAALRGNELGEAYHASDYMVYADLQLARDAAAFAAMDAALHVPFPANTPAAHYSRAAMPARWVLERGDWQGAATLELAPAGLPYTEALTLYARAIGAGHTGDAAGADKAAAELAVRRDKLTAAGNTYWATEVDIQQRGATAWAAFARKDTATALATMRDAADREDKNEKHIVTPGRIVPARELLADMLLLAGQPAAALQEYELSQQREPNRFRGYYGAAQAAAASGNRDKAVAYYRKLLTLAKDADTQRPELQQAKAFIAGP